MPLQGVRKHQRPRGPPPPARAPPADPWRGVLSPWRFFPLGAWLYRNSSNERQHLAKLLEQLQLWSRRRCLKEISNRVVVTATCMQARWRVSWQVRIASHLRVWQAILHMRLSPSSLWATHFHRHCHGDPASMLGIWGEIRMLHCGYNIHCHRLSLLRSMVRGRPERHRRAQRRPSWWTPLKLRLSCLHLQRHPWGHLETTQALLRYSRHGLIVMCHVLWFEPLTYFA